MSVVIDGELKTISKNGTTISLQNFALTLPSGNTLQRPTNSSTGMLRFNTSSNVFEGYDGNSWVNIQI